MGRSTGDEVDGLWALERGEVIRKKTKVRSKKLDVESRSQEPDFWPPCFSSGF
jgi:hypothetical protein